MPGTYVTLHQWRFFSEQREKPIPAQASERDDQAPLGFVQGSLAQVGPVKGGLVQVDTGQVSAAQIGPAQVRPGKARSPWL